MPVRNHLLPLLNLTYCPQNTYQNFANKHWSSTNPGSKYITTDLVEIWQFHLNFYSYLCVCFCITVSTYCGCSLTPKWSCSFIVISTPIVAKVEYWVLCPSLVSHTRSQLSDWALSYCWNYTSLTFYKERLMGANRS